MISFNDYKQIRDGFVDLRNAHLIAAARVEGALARLGDDPSDLDDREHVDAIAKQLEVIEHALGIIKGNLPWLDPRD